MKCLTICQPYAHLIVTPQAELPPGHKRKGCENRSWGHSYRGPLLIHAGKSLTWMGTYRCEKPAADSRGMPLPDDASAFGLLPFGQLVGIAFLADCVQIGWQLDEAGRRVRTLPKYMQSQYPWLLGHEHAEGPTGWILLGACKFPAPITMAGQQGLYDVAEFGPLWDRICEQIDRSGFNLVRALELSREGQSDKQRAAKQARKASRQF